MDWLISASLVFENQLETIAITVKMHKSRVPSTPNLFFFKLLNYK
jgi:hypothetical protein